ncbi:hypothetical protein Btru_050089 [Bulinus truncatus]|nr:hypothetical protein Btru_050089 [Bulinus truncatus]
MQHFHEKLRDMRGITCDLGYWGINCLNTCNNCFQLECNNLNGLCTQGCLGYSNPPYCSEGCLQGHYGKNCANKCLDSCFNNTCNAHTGKCLKCFTGFEGDFCLQECQPEFWGQDCLNNCSGYCYNSSCNNVNGSCNGGCAGAYDPPVCNKTCHSGSHGKNCSEQCSSTCVNGTCDGITGLCDFIENNAEISSSAIVGIVFAIVITGIVITLLFVIWRKKRSLLQMIQKCGFTIGATDFTDLEEFEGCNENQNRKSESTLANAYENSSEPPQSTVIQVEVFNSFMMSHDKDFFIKEFLKIPKPANVTTEAGSSSENKSKNRYQNIKPFDHNRVHLEMNTSSNDEGDYINASFISGFEKQEKFIASQGPHKGMVNDFIKMLWEQKVEKIVMLTDVVENGKTKCEKYWPDDGKAKFGSIKMSLKATHKFCDYTVSIFELSKKGGEFHTVTHFHFTAWPDISIPHSPWSLVEFKHKVSLTPSSNPVVVHCSAGVGRTGTYIAINNVLRQAEKTGKIDVFFTVAKLRQERMFMVQNSTQYEFIYKSVQIALLCSGTTYNGCSYVDTFNSLELKKSPLLEMLDNSFNGLKLVCSFDKQEDHVYTEYKYEDSDTSCHLKNRFSTIVPNPLFQPVLSKESKDLDHYINAVIIPGHKGKTHHILTQLPMPSTVIDFWRLVIQYRASLLVAFEFSAMLSDKSFGNYLLADRSFKTLPYEIHPTYHKQTNLWEEQRFTAHIRKTPFTSENHNIVHLKSLFTDFDPTKMVSFMKYIRSQNSLNKPIIFLCRNGASYSGFACALYLLMDRFDCDCYLSVPTVVGHMKSIRPEVIPNFEQYVLVHRVLQRYIELSSQYNNVGNNTLDKKKQACLKEEVTQNEQQQSYANSFTGHVLSARSCVVSSVMCCQLGHVLSARSCVVSSVMCCQLGHVLSARSCVVSSDFTPLYISESNANLVKALLFFFFLYYVSIKNVIRETVESSSIVTWFGRCGSCQTEKFTPETCSIDLFKPFCKLVSL